MNERELVAALKRRDEGAFRTLVERYQSALLRLALMYVRSTAVAEEVVQDAWLGVLQGIDAFEERASFKTWLFRILVNRARTRGVREGRTVAFADLAEAAGGHEAAVEPERFVRDGVEAGHWAVPPRSWGGSPEQRLLDRETLDRVLRAVAALPPAQREVLTLRDIEGLSAEEACNVLGVTDTNQRVLLHRARARVRAALEPYLHEE
jgi:RNA polymerase sigma-70 factor (ECF subfamily)